MKEGIPIVLKPGKNTNIYIDGMRHLQEDYGFTLSRSGISVCASTGVDKINVSFRNDTLKIDCPGKNHFYRALGLALERLRYGQEFELVEIPNFDMVGVFFDCSRNAVLTVESLKTMIKRMAVMGLTTMVLYMEDSYDVEGLPYFGYMRGRYSAVELKELDDYADMFGIELLPCIQGLGHMEQVLKWDHFADVRDTPDILLADNEKTYKMLDKMISSVSASLRTKRICIGMDEANGIGSGQYKTIHPHDNDKLKIFNNHVEKVVSICRGYQLTPYMASDMYFSLSSKTNWYYDTNAEIPAEVAEGIPQDVHLVFWDYYHEDKELYSTMLKAHMKIGRQICFVGGITNWGGLAVHYRKTFAATDAGLSECKKEGVREVLAATFGDNGAEGNLFGALLGMQLYAEHAYSQDIDMNRLTERFKACTGCDVDDFMLLEGVDRPDGFIGQELFVPNASKYLIYQDVLLGLFDRHIEGIDTRQYYRNLANSLEKTIGRTGDASSLFEVHYVVAILLELKADIGLRIHTAYLSGDRNGLVSILKNDLPDILERIKNLKTAHRKMWMESYKPFGWETVDIRYGGLAARVETAILRISDFLDGKIGSIPELDEERLYFTENVRNKETKLIGFNNYSRIVTAGIL